VLVSGWTMAKCSLLDADLSSPILLLQVSLTEDGFKATRLSVDHKPNLPVSDDPLTPVRRG
jgi:hypothetical protein